MEPITNFNVLIFKISHWLYVSSDMYLNVQYYYSTGIATLRATLSAQSRLDETLKESLFEVGLIDTNGIFDPTQLRAEPNSKFHTIKTLNAAFGLNIR